MAVQAQYVAHAFPHDSRATRIRPELDSALLGGGHLPTAAVKQKAAAVGDGNAAFSDLAACNRKRPRVGDGFSMEGHGALLAPLPAQQTFTPPQAGDLPQSRALCTGVASTSGRPSSAAATASSQSFLSLLYRHGVEVDALVRIETERLRAGLQAARRRHVRAVVSAMERAAARRLHNIEAELDLALARNAELEDRLRQTSAEAQAWQGVARGHEAVAAGLRATLDQLLLQSPPSCAGDVEAVDAEDAQSCCFVERADPADVAGSRARACRACGGAEACVLLLPCRHLCLCAGCEAAAEACPVCAAAKNASLHVLLS